MKTEYLLPCACGETIVVERSQAGLTARCRCGADVPIPTLRGLEKLERFIPVDQKQVSAWGPRQAALFLGGLIAGLAVAAMAVLWLTRPIFPQDKFESIIETQGTLAGIEDLTLQQTFELWEKEKQGPGGNPSPEQMNMMAQFQYDAIIFTRRMLLAMGAAIVGAVIFGVGLLLRRSPAASRATK